jgi:hypothetical protein
MNNEIRSCQNCKWNVRTEEKRNDVIIVRNKCAYLLPFWIHEDIVFTIQQQELQFHEYYKDFEKAYEKYGLNCQCHQFKGT